MQKNLKRRSNVLHAYSLFHQGTHQVSEHFKVKEFAQKDFRCDKVIVDSELINILEDIRAHFNKPVNITSGYRTPEYNAKIGGVKNSQHTKGTAADIKVKGVPARKVQEYLKHKYWDRYGIGSYLTFTHIDTRAKKARWRG
jgi:uncharacterized protein YcbK (DUF882 family)